MCFDAIDAMANDTQELCDINDVDELPHVQVLSDDGKIIWQQSGDVPLTKILRRLKYEPHS